jgi:hypothetical protein
LPTSPDNVATQTALGGYNVRLQDGIVTTSVSAQREPPSKQYPSLAPFFEALRHCQDAHRDVADKIVAASPGELSMTDLFLIAAVKRSLDLVAAIGLLIEQWNYSAMAPLVRLQVDSLLRLHYLSNAKDREQNIKRVIDGSSFRQLKDESGQKLTDARLLELAETDYPWLRAMYEETSKAVHFTVGHMTVPLVFHERPHVSVDMDVGLSRWTEDRIRECLHGTVIVSSEILRMANTWTLRPSNASTSPKAG